MQSGVSVLSGDPSRTLSWVVHTPLLSTSSHKGVLGQDLQAHRGWPHDSVVCPLTQTEALRRPPLAFLRASGRPRSCPSFFVGASPSSRSFGWVQGECRAPKSRARWPQSSRCKILPTTCSGDQCSSTMKWPYLCSLSGVGQPLVHPAGIAVRTCPPLGPCRHHSLSCGLFLSSLRLTLELSFV